MRYSIYLLLMLIYSLISAITFYVVRTMRREDADAAPPTDPSSPS